MKVLQPILTNQTISIIPRSETFGVVSMSIVKDGDGVSQTIVSPTLAVNGNFVDVTFASNILEEGYSYFLEITNDGDLWYRDKIYVTAQSDFTIKHKQPQNNYTEYNVVDDNTYIV